jgi:type VI secretion system secreted protein Hcp
MALNAYLKIDGIIGASTASKHKDEIEVLSFSWGIKNSTISGGGGGGSGKAEVSDFSFTKEVAKDSPELFVSVCTGEHHKNAVLTVEGISTAAKGGSQSFYKVTFEDVLISGVSLAGQDNALPMEQISLNFAKVRLEYRDATGGTKAETCDFRSTDFDALPGADAVERRR